MRWLTDLLTGRGGMRLSTRIAALSLGLLLLVQGGGFWTIRASISEVASAQLAEDLRRGERVWQDTLGHQAEKIRLAGRMAAKDFGFQSTLFGARSDDDTVASALDSLADRVGADFAAFVAVDGQLRGAFGPEPVPAELAEISAQLARGPGQAAVRLLGGRPVHLMSTEILAPDRKGWLVFGYPIDETALARMAGLAGMQAAVMVPSGDGLRPALSTLPATQQAALPSAAPGDTLQLDGDEMRMLRVPLGAAEVWLLRSFSQAVAPYRQLQLTLLAITLGGLLVMGVGSAWTARHVTTPLRSLVGASQRLGRGDYGDPVLHTGARGEVGDLARAFDAMRLDISAQLRQVQAHAARIQDLAFHDQLTGLPNRESFRVAVQQRIELGASEATPFAVVVLNLNRFKMVNGALGHRAGDRLLRLWAERLVRQRLRADDVVARLAGDEFALLLPGLVESKAVSVVRRLDKALEPPITLDGQDQAVDLRAAFGIACWPAHGDEALVLLNRAEVAMHEAKRRTETVAVYAAGMDPDSATSLTLLSELRQAISRNELRLHLQPKFSLASGAIVGAEALVRWQHPQRGMVPPLAFIPFAEDTGFVRELTAWIVGEAARQWPALHAAGLQRLSVNLSARDLMDPGLPQRLHEILDTRGVPAHAFCLEITESAVMDDPQRAQATLHALKAMGFKLSIDDFGEGYTSLQHLRHLPVDELKVDAIFVKRMDREPDDEKVVRAVTNLAHDLGLQVVAEGVETRAVWDHLQAIGCDEAQGYLMCRPLPADELPDFAAKWAVRHLGHEAALG